MIGVYFLDQAFDVSFTCLILVVQQASLAIVSSTILLCLGFLQQQVEDLERCVLYLDNLTTMIASSSFENFVYLDGSGTSPFIVDKSVIYFTLTVSICLCERTPLHI